MCGQFATRLDETQSGCRAMGKDMDEGISLTPLYIQTEMNIHAHAFTGN